MRIFDCSNSEDRPANRGYGGPVENAVVSMLKKYGLDYGMDFVDNPEDADILFTNDVFPKALQDLKKVRVKRMDGIFWQKSLEPRNAPLNLAAKEADHVIFVSYFSRAQLYYLYRWLPKSEAIIRNWGADRELFFPDKNRNIDKPRKYIAVATSWARPEKRLGATLEFAEKILKNDGELYLVGTLPEVELPRNVTSLGYMSAYRLASVLREMDAMVNLSFHDAAPKVVAEAISCGLPVLYAHSGGTSELVQPGCQAGIGIQEANDIQGRILEDVPRLTCTNMAIANTKFVGVYRQLRMVALELSNYDYGKRMVELYAESFKLALEKEWNKLS